MGAMNDAVTDRIGSGWIDKVVVPEFGFELTRDDGCTQSVAIFEHLE